MDTIIASGLLGILFFLVGAFSRSSEGDDDDATERQNRKILGYSLVAIVGLLGVSICELVDIPIFGYTTEFVHFGTYERVFLILMEVCVAYFWVQNFRSLPALGRPMAEQVALVFFMMTGGAVLAGADNLLLLFLGIEIVSFPLYIFTGLHRHHLKSNEATVKYFLTGAFFSGILLLGIALLYGVTGSFDLQTIRETADSADPVVWVGVSFVLFSFAFKVSAVPFHFWTPDVYEGAPSVYTALMATIAKSFFFIAFLHTFRDSFVTTFSTWSTQMAIIIVLTLIVGNLIAMQQNGVKRLMSYSSIAQAAFMLFAIYGHDQYGSDGLIIYTFSYSLAVLGVFAIIQPVANNSIDRLNGLAKSNPVIAVALAVFLFSLIGIPFTGGFMGKYYMLLSAANGGIHWSVLLVAFVASAMSAYYYLRIIRSVFFKEGTDLSVRFRRDAVFEGALVFNAVLLIVTGIQPAWIMNGLNF